MNKFETANPSKIGDMVLLDILNIMQAESDRKKKLSKLLRNEDLKSMYFNEHIGIESVIRKVKQSYDIVD